MRFWPAEGTPPPLPHPSFWHCYTPHLYPVIPPTLCSASTTSPPPRLSLSLSLFLSPPFFLTLTFSQAGCLLCPINQCPLIREPPLKSPADGPRTAGRESKNHLIIAAQAS